MSNFICVRPNIFGSTPNIVMHVVLMKKQIVCHYLYKV